MRFYLEIDLALYWVEVKGTWGVDNFGEFRIDGAVLPAGSGIGTSLPAGNIVTNYMLPRDFSILQEHALSQSTLRLGIGWHTLEVWVNNEGQW